MGCSKNSSKRKVYSDIGLPQKIRKISNKHLDYHLKELEKEQTKPKVSIRKKIKIRVEVNKNRDQKNNRKVNETEVAFQKHKQN